MMWSDGAERNNSCVLARKFERFFHTARYRQRERANSGTSRIRISAAQDLR